MDCSSVKVVDAVVVGAGFSGLYTLHKLRGLGLSAQVIDRASDIGGTWFWNRYPGATCDILSVDYSFSFCKELEQEWQWSHRYAAQPEILKYIHHVADRFDLWKDIKLNTSVTDAIFEEDTQRWAVKTDKGDQYSAKFVVMATGCLSVPKADLGLKGIDTFEGRRLVTHNWPTDPVDFSEARVGVIGTGSSGVQSIPIIAKQAKTLHVFQRTATFAVPAHNRPLSKEESDEIKAKYEERRNIARATHFWIDLEMNLAPAVGASEEERRQNYERRWSERGGFVYLGAYMDLVFNKESNDTAADFIRGKIRSIVKDPETAEKLCPKDFPLGTKRMCVDSGYYETYNRDNVTLVDIKSNPIDTFTAKGIRLTDGTEVPLDVVVLATGFDAMTGALLAINIRGRGGVSLKDKWAEGPRSYLGLAVAGFPNLFTITGPGSPSVLANMVMAIEQHVDWIADAVKYVQTKNLKTLEATNEAQDAWVQHVADVANMTLFPLANSWYLGANVPGKPRVFTPYVGGMPAYTQKCSEVASKDYEGFVLA